MNTTSTKYHYRNASMKKLTLFFIYCSLWGHASEFSDWQREESKKVFKIIEEGVISSAERLEIASEEYINLSIIMQLTLGDAGNYDKVLRRHKIPPLSYYLNRMDTRKSADLSFRFGQFAYSRGFKNIARAIWESVSDEDRCDIDYALGVFAAYDEGDVPKALKYFDASKGGRYYSSLSADILHYISAPDSQKEQYAQQIKELKENDLPTFFDIDWFIVNILDHSKSFKELESLLWSKAKEGDIKAKLHLHRVYEWDIITFKKPKIQYALLLDLALNDKMPEAQYILGMDLAAGSLFEDPLSASAKWDGAALIFRSHKHVKKKWLDFPIEKLTVQELDDLKNKDVKYNPYWVLGPLI